MKRMVLLLMFAAVLPLGAEVPRSYKQEKADEEEVEEAVEQEEIPYLALAESILTKAGLPGIPVDAEDIRVYAWRESTAGLFAAFRVKPEEVEPYLERMPADVGRAFPIPKQYLIAPNQNAPWFQPATIEKGFCAYRSGPRFAAPEIYRLYADPSTGQIYIAYRWNLP